MNKKNNIPNIILIFLSYLYGSIVSLRNLFYDYKLLSEVSFSKPIISIGNITVGGTGKTPLVIFLAQLIKKNNRNVGIISRGYGRKSKGIKVVHNGKNLVSNVNISGDEPYLIGSILKNVPVIVSENRVIGIKYLLNNYKIDIIIMDDGFQHRKVDNDLNILLISSNDLKSYYHVLPRGKLRENLKGIQRADCIIYTKTENYQFPNIHSEINKYYNKYFLLSIYKSNLLKYENKDFKEITPHTEPIFAFCGIAEPESFISSIKKLALNIIEYKFYKDHQIYTNLIINELINNIDRHKINNIITTEKDFVKLPKTFINKYNLYIIKVNIKLNNIEFLEEKINKLY